MKRLAGKRVFLTGATRGIGKALALDLARCGAILALHGRDLNAFSELQRKLEAIPDVTYTLVAGDLRDTSTATDLFEEALEALSGIDILINNASARGSPTPFHEVDLSEIDEVLTVALRAPAVFCSMALRNMTIGSHIVNILSSACLADLPTYAIYTTAKCGLEGLTRVLTKEARSRGIKVTAIYPGSTVKEISSRGSPFMSPEEVSYAVISALLSPGNSVTQRIVLRSLADTNY
jgi:3-oxoacyl-[acyl-carrier protein] reductase